SVMFRSGRFFSANNVS
ncbi:hypothetical protein D039_5148B, partial [Vibrio parahaemolyticus EKP-028]